MKLIRDTGAAAVALHAAVPAQPGLAVRRPLDAAALPGAVRAAAQEHVPLGGQNVLDFFLPGILALLAFGSGISMGFGTIFELQAGVVERFRVTPTSRLALLLGPLVSGMSWMFLFDLRAGRSSASRSASTCTSAACSCSPCCSALFMVAMAVVLGRDRARHEGDQRASRRSSTASTCRSCCSPACCCRSRSGPEWMRVLAHFNPLYYLVTASRSLAHGTFTGGATWQAFAVIVPLCALLAGLGDARLPPRRVLTSTGSLGGVGACTHPRDRCMHRSPGRRMRRPAQHHGGADRPPRRAGALGGASVAYEQDAAPRGILPRRGAPTRSG